MMRKLYPYTATKKTLKGEEEEEAGAIKLFMT